MSPDSTSGIDLEDYNGNSRINLKADTINFSGEEDMSSYSGGIFGIIILLRYLFMEIWTFTIQQK